MNPIEILARREAMGLNQAEFSQLLGIKQSTLSLWESGDRHPRDPASVSLLIGEFEEWHDRLIDQLCELAEHSSAVRNTSAVEIRTYRSNEAYWDDNRQAKSQQIPASMHRSAAAWARRILAEESGIDAYITD